MDTGPTTSGFSRPPKAVLRPCRVPWMISPSTSGVTLIHTETGVEPECRVILGGGRLLATNEIDSRRIELTFAECWHARVAPKHDERDLDSEGFDLRDGSPDHFTYLGWLFSEWRSRGYCPMPGFWMAIESSWLGENSIEKARHYVIGGRDGYVEVIARTYSWKEWLWDSGGREEVPGMQPIAASGDASDDVDN